MTEQTTVPMKEKNAKKKPVLKSLIVCLLLTGLAAYSVPQAVRAVIDLAISLDLLEPDMLMFIQPLRAMPFTISPISIVVGVLLLWLPVYGFCAKRGFFRRFFLLILILILLILVWVGCLLGLRIGLVSLVRLLFNFLQMSGTI